MQDTVNNERKENSKNFWSFVKSKGQEFTPLKNKDGFLQSDTQAKAILSEQFKSLFTREDLTNIPDKGPSTILSMSEFKIDWKGVHKLLKNLKTHKATGPDTIPNFIYLTLLLLFFLFIYFIFFFFFFFLFFFFFASRTCHNSILNC